MKYMQTAVSVYSDWFHETITWTYFLRRIEYIPWFQLTCWDRWDRSEEELQGPSSTPGVVLYGGWKRDDSLID